MEEKKIELEKLDLPFVDPDERVEFIKVDCPSCGSIVEAANIDLNSKIGKCTSCQSLFSVEKKLAHIQRNVKQEEEVKRPEGVEIYHFKNEMEIETLQPISVFQILNLSLSPWIALLAGALYFVKDVHNAIFFMIACSLLTAFGIYRLIRRKDHKVYLNINEKNVTVVRRPKMMITDKVYDRSEIEQVYVKQTADGLALCFIIDGANGQKHENVMTRISNVGHAKYMEQEIESYLGITDRVVSGEL